MRRDDIIDLLQRHRAELEQLGVQSLYLFGSMARDDASDVSDVDLFFDHEKGRLGLYELIEVKRARVEHPWPQGRHNSLHPGLKSRDRGVRDPNLLKRITPYK